MATAAVTDITDDETKAIEAVNFDNLTGAGNDAFHDEKDEAPPTKKKREKGKKAEPISPAEQKIDGTVVAEEPDITSPEWHEFVISKFTEDELDADGNPFVHGLRRVTELLIGPILQSKAHVVQAPTFVPDMAPMLQPATVEYTIRILCVRTPEDIEPYELEYTDVGDVFGQNTDPTYARFPSSMAATRAEGRAYRKALRLKRIVASEELTEVPLDEASLKGQISPTQINFIDILCRRLKIDAMKYINLGSKKYANIQEVSYTSAQKMTEHLNTLTNDITKVPEDIKGYKLDWTNTE